MSLSNAIQDPAPAFPPKRRLPPDFLRDSSLFTPWTDPQSGVESFLLSRRVAPVQQSFYYVNPSFSRDGRHFWFYAAFPPGGSANQGRVLAAADLALGRVQAFPETAFTDASPLVDPATGEAYWCAGLEIWKRPPEPGARPVLVNRLPETLARNRRPWRLATHLTFSADGRAVNFDAEIGGEWHVGHAPLDGGEPVVWQTFGRCHNHGQFSPADPDLQLIAQDFSIHPLTGEVERYENRLWLLRRGGTAKPIFGAARASHGRRGANPHYAGDTAHAVADERALHGHEWWGADGRHVWYVHYGQGMARVAVDGSRAGIPELVWPHDALTHGHADAPGNRLVCDCLPSDPGGRRRVTFRNRATGREIDIVSRMPEVPADLGRYHVHPHPQFCLDDSLICYTTTVLGRVDVAFCPVKALAALTE